MSEEGSITPLISIYFMILMICTFIVANVASTYVDRRGLINLTEAALAQATHELDEMRYYYQVPLPHYLGGVNIETVPIDCGDAARSFREVMTTSSRSTRDKAEISVLSFHCDGRTLRARVSRVHYLPFSLPILLRDHFINEVEVAVSTRYL